MGFFTKKNFATVREVSKTSGFQKNLTSIDLIMLGLGSIIGTGVFVFTGMVAALYSGPAVTISYLIAGVTCIFVALSYAELATMLPASGSVYTYSFVAFGEVFAWLVGSVLFIELTFGAATVAAGWSGYIQSILAAGGVYIPKAYTTSLSEGGIINLPAVAIVAFVTLVLWFGTRDSKRLNAILVCIKLGAVFAFIVAAAPHVNLENWDQFMPFPFDEVVVGASILFFAFTGFSAVAAAAEECKNPKKDLTIGIIASLILSTLVYISVGALVTLIAHYTKLNNPQALAYALTLNGSHVGSAIVATGAVCGMTTVIMANIYAQSRIFYVISRDGLLPKSFAKLHAKYDSPYITIIFVSIITIILAGFFPIKVLGQLSSMGALIDYIVVSIVVMLFRVKRPDEVRPFKCPILFVIAPLSLLACLYLLFKQIFSSNGKILITGKIIIVWFIAMFILYLVRRIALKVKPK